MKLILLINHLKIDSLIKAYLKNIFDSYVGNSILLFYMNFKYY